MSAITRQVKGMDITLDPRVLEDWDVLNDLMSLIVDEGEEITPQQTKDMVKSINRLTELLYGESFEKIKKRLRKANGGFLTTTTITEFINETFDVFSKNS